MTQLKKKIISNRRAEELNPKGFSKLAKSDTFIDEDRLKGIYDEIFYIAPKTGKESHTNIIEQVDDYVNHQENLRLDNEIKKLTKKLSGKETELVVLENPSSKEHPVYEDGAIIVVGENGQQYQDMTTKYIMQEGRRRAFSNESIFITTKKLLQIPAGDLDGRYYLTINDLNSLPDGPPIADTIDLQLKGNDLETDIPDIMAVSAYIDIELECLGNEVSDYVNTVTGNILDLGVNTFQFYLNNDACVVKYIKDDYINDSEGPTLSEEVIPKGEKSTIRILRETDMGNNLIPTDISTNPTYGYSNNLPTNVAYNGNELFNYTKLWGPNREYPSVVYASGRLMSKEIENTHIGDVLSQFGETQDISQKLFNGLPTNQTAEGAFGEADIQLITDPNYTGQARSTYGTKLIYKNPGFYGSLNQSSDLQSKVFNRSNSPYYQLTTSQGYPVYGQPIIRYDNKYCVVVNTYKSNLTRYVQFLDIENNHIFKKRRGQVEDAMGFGMDYSSSEIFGMKWETLDKSRIRFIGLQEYKTNEQAVDDNIFNSVGGSNYEINPINSL